MVICHCGHFSTAYLHLFLLIILPVATMSFHQLLYLVCILLPTLFVVHSDAEYTSPDKSFNITAGEYFETCTPDMFGGDMNAYWACATQTALQRNWFPSPITGLYTYQHWNGCDGFWQDGSILETLANVNYYGNHTRYQSALLTSYRDLGNLLHAYHPQPSFDDEMWYGLSFARIYEVMRNETFLNISHQVLNWTWTLGWDKSGRCSGGVWFDSRLSKKITVTNAQVLKLAAKLYRLGGKQDNQLLDMAEKVWNYIVNNSVINETTHLVSDEIDPYTCKPFDKYNITYNSGVLLGALTELYRVTENATILNIAHKVANASILYNTVDGILTEYCDWDNSCENDLDARMFKGIFVRNLRYLIDISDPLHQSYYRSWIQRNIESLLSKSMCKDIFQCNVSFPDGPAPYKTIGPVFGVNWRGPYRIGLPMPQAAALDLFTAGIGSNVKCRGESCFYNPYFLLPPRVNCKTARCPAGYTCCTWDVIYNTCCTPQQSCYSGACWPWHLGKMWRATMKVCIYSGHNPIEELLLQCFNNRTWVS